uniref:Ig-like domain-containing protein n=1 Tax=Pseudonaja textilis TaxID=8673 RepID=A0A670Z9W4_PSETE
SHKTHALLRCCNGCKCEKQSYLTVFTATVTSNARPILQLTTMPQGETFVVAVCNLSKFYPSQINVQWLQSGVPQEQIKSEVHRMHNGMFSINSVFLPQKNNVKVTYVCRVEHEGLETPLEQSVHWQPEGEGDVIIPASLPVTQNTRTTFFLSPSRPTVTPSIPSIPVIPWPLGVILALVCGFILGAGIVSCICKGNLSHLKK